MTQIPNSGKKYKETTTLATTGGNVKMIKLSFKCYSNTCLAVSES